MSLPNHLAGYNDCLDLFEEAVASQTGLRVCFKTEGEAKFFIMRMHQARALQRAESKRIYPPDDKRWGFTDYDQLIIRHPQDDEEGNWWVYIERHSANILAKEPI